MGPATAAPGGKGNIMKKAFSIIALIVALSMLAACGSGSAEPTPTPEPTLTATPEPTPDPTPEPTPTPEPLPHLDYANAEAFEAALNAGENLTGKTVRFVAGELHPQSIYGYNIWAGQHLNFVSPTHPNVEEGQEVTVKANEIISSLGSWIISYEFIEAEADENTIE